MMLEMDGSGVALQRFGLFPQGPHQNVRSFLRRERSALICHSTCFPSYGFNLYPCKFQLV